MTPLQLTLALALPSATALMGILVNVGYFVALNGRMTRIEDRLDNVMGALHELDRRVTKIEIRLGIAGENV